MKGFLNWVAVFLACWSCMAVAQVQDSVSPNPARPWQGVTVTVVLPQMTCFNEIRRVDVAENGRTIAISYVVGPATKKAKCFTVMPPLVLEATLGPRSVGEYLIEVSGTYQGSPNPTVRLPLSVSEAVHTGDSTAIPTLGLAGILILLIAMGCIGALACRLR